MAGGAAQAEQYGDPTVTSAIASSCTATSGTAAWISCAGKPPVGPAGRPARGRRALADLRLAARGGARAPRAPTASADDHVTAPGGVPLGAALRRLPRRRIGPREPRRPESHPPREPLPAEAARSRVFRRRSTSSSRRRPGSSRRATDCGSRSRAPTGRTPGRLRMPGALGVARASVELELPVLDGPPSRPPPPSLPPPPDRKARRAGQRAAADRAPDRARHRGPPDARRDELRVSLRRPLRARRSRRATTAWSASPRGTPAARGRAARTRYSIEWPEASVTTEAHLELALHVGSVPRRHRGHSLGRRAGRHRPCRASLRAHDPAPAAIALAVAGPHLAGGYLSARKQAARWSDLPAAASNSGSLSLQASIAIGQRGWKRQPDGTSIGFGVSPVRI